MFRISKQLQIVEGITESTTHDQLAGWLKVIVLELSLSHAKNLASQLFLHSKQKLSNDALDKLLKHKESSQKTEKKGLADDTKQNCTSYDFNVNSDANSRSCYLSALSKDEFIKIGSYLSAKSRLYLSMTNRLFHRRVQNRDYFEQCDKNHSSDKEGIKLSEKRLTTIYNNNCIVECLHTKDILQIVCKSVKNNCQSQNERDCILSKLIDKVGLGLGSSCDYDCVNIKNIGNINYDLIWLRKVLGNVKCLYVSNNWSCAFDHLPMEWLFSHKVNYNNLECKESTPKPIKIIGSNSRDSNRSRKLSKTSLEILTKKYQEYHKKLIEKQKSINKKIKNYDDHDTDSKDNNDCKNKMVTRSISYIWFDRQKCDPFHVCQTFGNNLTGMILEVPRNWDNKCRLETLDQFFSVFHHNLNSLEIHVDRAQKKNRVSNSNNNNSNQDIINHWFKNNDQLCKDLRTTEDELPFDAFLTKYGCNGNRYGLAQIRSFVIDFDRNIENSMILQIFNNDKLMRLLNIEQTVYSLMLRFFDKYNTWFAKRSSICAISKLVNVSAILIELRHKEMGSDDGYDSQLEKLYSLLLIDILVEIAIKSLKMNQLNVQLQNYNSPKNFNYTIKINSKHELAYNNRENLRNKISLIVQKSHNDAIQALKTNSTKQMFRFERCYTM